MCVSIILALAPFASWTSGGTSQPDVGMTRLSRPSETFAQSTLVAAFCFRHNVRHVIRVYVFSTVYRVLIRHLQRPDRRGWLLLLRRMKHEKDGSSVAGGREAVE